MSSQKDLDTAVQEYLKIKAEGTAEISQAIDNLKKSIVRDAIKLLACIGAITVAIAVINYAFK